MSDSVQWSILLPLILLTVLGLVQTGIWLHGRSVASNAAVAGAEYGALLGAGSAEAKAVAQRVASDGGLQDITVSLVREATTIRLTVTGRMPTFFDLGQTRVRESATRPLERVTEP